MPPSQALMLAEEKGLDLVEIAASASPPVCRIMNSGKFFYQQSKRESEARKHQRHIQVKEVKFRPKIDEHDFQFKLRNAERFLNGGNKVKSVVIYRGREVVHMEVGRRHLERLASELSEVCNVESPPKREGNTMVQILAPKKEAKPSKKSKKGEGEAPKKAKDAGAAGTKGEAPAAAKKKALKKPAGEPARTKKKKEAGSPAATAAGKTE
jgi:translation initiation factor IF-3